MSVILSDRSFHDISRTKYNDIKAKITIPNEISTDILASRPDNVKSELNLDSEISFILDLLFSVSCRTSRYNITTKSENIPTIYAT